MRYRMLVDAVLKTIRGFDAYNVPVTTTMTPEDTKGDIEGADPKLDVANYTRYCIDSLVSSNRHL